MIKRFTFIFALVISSAALAQQAPSPPAAPVVVDFPTHGIQFTSPAGWQPRPPSKVNTIANWVKLDQDGHVIGVMVLEHNKITRPLEQELASFSRTMNIKTSRNYKCDDEVGFWIHGSRDTFTALQIFEVRKNNVDYRLTLGRPQPGPDGEDDATMTALRESWKFRPLEEPFEHLVFNAKPLPELGAFQILLPINARPDTVETPKTQIHFALINLKTQDDEFRVRADLREGPVPTAQGMTTTLTAKLVDQISFSDLGGNILLSNWAKEKQLPLFNAFAIVPLAENRSVVLSFCIDRAEPEVQQKYLALARQITLSIKPLSPAAAANAGPHAP